MLIPFAGLTVLLLAYQFAPHLLRFEWRGLGPAILADLAVLLGTGAVAVFFFGVGDLTGLSQLKDITLARAALAGLEDALFVLPALMLPLPLATAFLGVGSVVFTLGHAYQGHAMWSKVLVVPVVYLMAQRYGIYTTMAAHSIIDVCAVAALRYLSQFIPAR